MTKITLIPRVSEKAYTQSQSPSAQAYVFEVPLSANKHTVARAITDEYDVTVTEVRTLIVKGKPKQSYRKGSRPQSGRRSDIKKAYITLKAGDSLPLFAEEAEADAKATEAEAKQAKKEAAKVKKTKKDQKEDK